MDLKSGKADKDGGNTLEFLQRERNRTYRKKLPDFGPCLSQSINQEEMSDKASEGPIRFDRVDNLCL